VDDGTLNPNNGPKTIKHRKPNHVDQDENRSFRGECVKTPFHWRDSGRAKVWILNPPTRWPVLVKSKIEGIKAKLNELVSESQAMTEHHAYDKVCSSNLCKDKTNVGAHFIWRTLCIT
jgi:hypothetical protein